MYININVTKTHFLHENSMLGLSTHSGSGEARLGSREHGWKRIRRRGHAGTWDPNQFGTWESDGSDVSELSDHRLSLFTHLISNRIACFRRFLFRQNMRTRGVLIFFLKSQLYVLSVSADYCDISDMHTTARARTHIERINTRQKGENDTEGEKRSRNSHYVSSRLRSVEDKPTNCAGCDPDPSVAIYHAWHVSM